MHALPGGLSTDQQPPTTIPLCHFVVALAFLLAGVGLGIASLFTSLPGLGSLASLHAFLVGWICLTIMGAMTQFVPVWSGVSLHSRRLAIAQLWLVSLGLGGFVATLLVGVDALAYLPAFATLLVAGVWTFVYNVGRTLARARPLDATERHFAVALCAFAAAAPLGFTLAVDFTTPVFDSVLAITRTDVIFLHATLAVFGVVLPTIVGALSQLAKMFTQTSLESADRTLLALEEATLPAGVVALAVGRAIDAAIVARLGALSVLVGALAFSIVVGRLLARATTDPSPMTIRYWVVVASLGSWAILTLPPWWADPVGYDVLLGRPGATVLLVVGVFGFVVVGTLYHVVPFVIWHDRYGDLLGFEPVPMIDDLYSSRLERADRWATIVGFLALAASRLLPVSAFPLDVGVVGGVLLTIGFTLFVVNMLSTIRRHGPDGIGGALAPTIGPFDRVRDDGDSLEDAGRTSD